MRFLYYCLAALADRPLADSIVGDLEEQRRTRGAQWFCRSALGILLHFLGQKVRGALVNVRTSRGGTPIAVISHDA
jgi:hypothetical protein